MTFDGAFRELSSAGGQAVLPHPEPKVRNRMPSFDRVPGLSQGSFKGHAE